MQVCCVCVGHLLDLHFVILGYSLWRSSRSRRWKAKTSLGLLAENIMLRQSLVGPSLSCRSPLIDSHVMMAFVSLMYWFFLYSAASGYLYAWGAGDQVSTSYPAPSNHAASLKYALTNTNLLAGHATTRFEINLHFYLLSESTRPQPQSTSTKVHSICLFPRSNAYHEHQ